MARIARKEILGDGLYYHIITRGNGKKAIFRCKTHYKFFIKIVQHYLDKFPLYIYHYCLMKNHVHLLIQTTEGQLLSKFMQGVSQKYATYFGNKYGWSGHLFQDRYKCLLIDKESYLLDCGRYIERNPIRANIVDNVYEYPWSSFSFYANGKPDKLITKIDTLYLELGNEQQKRQKNYKEYVLETRPSDLIEK